jgi:hypothetical protein
MKNKLLSILGNGLPWGLAFFALAFIIGYRFNIGLSNTLITGGFVAVPAVLANGLIYNRFSKRLKDLENIYIPLDVSEFVVLQSAANHLIDGNLVPGKLLLTDKRLVFKPFKPRENEPQEYMWAVILLKPAAFYKSLWNAGGEFLLDTGEEVPVMFEVNKLKPWKEIFRDRV